MATPPLIRNGMRGGATAFHGDVMLLGCLGVLLIAAGSYAVILNWSALVLNGRNARAGIDRHVSFVPVLGPLLISVGTLLLHLPAWRWLLAPWLADIGTWTLVLLLFIPRPRE